MTTHQFQVRVWMMESTKQGERQIKYSTMMESEPEDIGPETPVFNVRLDPSKDPESERIRLGDLALTRFKEVNNGALPESAFCLITYSYRAQFEGVVLVFDLQPSDDVNRNAGVRMPFVPPQRH